MENKKYILTDITMYLGDKILHRIKAVKKFGNVRVGELGGWIGKEENLSHDGDCWVYDEAKVFDNARVFENAKISDGARVFYDAKVFEDAEVSGSASVFDNAKIHGNANIFGYAEIYGNADVDNNARIYGEATVFENASIYGNAKICGKAQVFGDTKVYGNAQVLGNARICNNADIFWISKIDDKLKSTTIFTDEYNKILIKHGCFLGTLEEFEKKIEFEKELEKKYNDNNYDKEHEALYKALIELIKIHIDELNNRCYDDKNCTKYIDRDEFEKFLDTTNITNYTKTEKTFTMLTKIEEHIGKDGCIVYAHWKDGNGNTWDCEKFTEEEAEAACKTLINCKNCNNCKNCVDCVDCIDCTNCRNCKTCRYCNWCKDCVDCYYYTPKMNKLFKRYF